MAKRFTDSEKWKDDWYLNLSNDNRIVWQYLLDNCTIAGVIKVSYKHLNFCCNVKYDEKKLMEFFEGRVFNCGDYYFIPKFIKFQYPKGLKSDKPVIIGIRNELSKYGLIDDNNELKFNDNIMIANDYLIIKDKDKDKDKDKELDTDMDTGEEEEKEEPKKNISKIIPPEFDWIIERCGVMNYPEYETESEKFFDYYNSNGWKVGKNNMKDWTSALSNWFKNYKTYNQNGITTKSDSRNSKGFDLRKNTWYTGT